MHGAKVLHTTHVVQHESANSQSPSEESVLQCSSNQRRTGSPNSVCPSLQQTSMPGAALNHWRSASSRLSTAISTTKVCKGEEMWKWQLRRRAGMVTGMLAGPRAS